MELELRPRLCFLVRTEHGYGFHLHGEKNKGGQFIRKVVPGSSADLAGLRPGDRLVEVNGENVENETHPQVVSRICEVSHRTRLLVVDRDTDDYLRSQGLACTEVLAVEMGTLSPRPSPMPTPSASPVPRVNFPLTFKFNHRQVLDYPAAESHTHLTSQDKEERCSVASSSATDTELRVEPSPEPTDTLLPRLCHLLKEEHGYGFNLQSDKKRGGQFVRSVDPNSPAERAGVRPEDRIVEVNEVSTRGLRHSEVVALIKSERDEVRLLLVDQETDELFHRLGIAPTSAHIKEVYVDVRPAESTRPTPSPTIGLPATDAPIINVSMTDAAITNLSPKSRANGSTASQSSRSSTTHSEISSSDMSIQIPDDDDRRISDPFVESGLRLSPTAAEAKQKIIGNRNKKRAPPMDWCRKQEVFSNF
ncbi:Na(+)/H(+) exchange regulatory cofactor NHE-RF2 [Nematolebias whitei]|uniref:Na(+)/H(+) exchange regulatory cofactor NHE-RF2 n=1 Tax=Nematolebias whitei TaxID=451745 RepID=UPI0018993B84|nr:Na(+)/H(+) exchange regulatory cofactor NHE-RF2 [Nematolebias whitei]